MKTLSRVVHSADPRGILSLQDELLMKVNPALRKEVLDGVLTERITLTDQWQLFSHGLGRTPVGWVAVEPQWVEPTWAAPTLAAGWSNSGGGNVPAGYRTVPGGRVQVRGQVTNAGAFADGTTIFTLPTGYVAAYTEHFACVCENGAAARLPVQITVGTDGTIKTYNMTGVGYNAYISLNGICFQATGAAARDIEETETSNPDRSLFLRLRTCNSGSTTKLWVF